MTGVNENSLTNILRQEPGKVQAVIRSSFNTLSPAEQKVASYVLENTVEFLYQTVSAISRNCGVGEATVIRFSRSVGFSGVQDLKLALAMDIAVIKAPTASKDEGDSLSARLKARTEETILAIEDTFRLIESRDLEQAVDAIVKARRVEFYGLGASGLSAVQAQYKFMCIGVTAVAHNDFHMQSRSATTLGSSDVVVAMSNTGALQSILHSVGLARKAGATIICLTGVAGSPLTEISDIVLLTGGSEKWSIGKAELKWTIAQLHAIDLLYMAVVERLGDDSQEYLEKTSKALLDILA
jgi:DNA-binding MurR/RpiR family transcriptional regulator